MKQKLTRRSFLKAAGTMAVAVSAAGLFAGCEEMPEEPDNAKILWTIQDNGGGTATLTGYDKTGPQPSGYVVIPSEVSGRTITSINANFGDCTGWTRVTIPGTVKEIKSFGCCSDMKVLSMENGVETINYSAFDGWESLETVSLPQTLKTIRSYAFYGCKNLKQVSFPASMESIGTMAFMGTALEEVELPRNVKVDARAFLNLETLKRVVINSGAVFSTMYDHIFRGCTNLSEVVFNGSVEVIGGSMFYECKALKSIELPYGLKKISKSAFYHTGLQSIKIPITVTGIEEEAFAGCEALASVSGLPASAQYSSGIFNQCTALQKVALPEGLQKISSKMFYKCTGLKVVYIPVSVKTVEQSAFNECPNLKTVYYGGYRENWQAMYVEGSGSALFTANVYGPCTASDLK